MNNEQRNNKEWVCKDVYCYRQEQGWAQRWP